MELVEQTVLILKLPGRQHNVALNGIIVVVNVKYNNMVSEFHRNIETQRFFVLLLIFFLFKLETANSQSYNAYHHMIATAEEFYFVHDNVDSSLTYFQKSFETFDFVFARDAINALQIAYRENRPIEYFLKISFKSGVTPAIISTIPALNEFVNDSLANLSVMGNYIKYRSHYLDRINVACLKKTYILGIYDQIAKYKEGENVTEPLFKLANLYGLPGEKICGIEDLEITKELGAEAPDFLRLRDSISSEYGKNLRYYSLDNNSLIMHLPIVIMLHNYCTYKDYKKALYEAYLSGNIYSREIGCIYDNAFRGDDPECLMHVNKGIFGLNRFLKYSTIDKKKANYLRAKWGICSMEADFKKKELEKLGYKFIWDYW